MAGITHARLAALIALLPLAGAIGCTTIEDTVGPLPDAFRTATADLSGQGYPDLSKIPAAPATAPAGSNWSSLEAGLVQERRALEANRQSSVLTPAQESVAWADAPRAAMNTDPRAVDVPDTLAEAEGWAQAERARMEAVLRRLPPVQGVPN